MGFVDFFRKKWKHSDPEVRAEAVRDLDNQDELAQVLRGDTDVRVRKIALKRVTDPDVLAEVAERDADDTLRRNALEKATEILLARALADGNEAQSQAALQRLLQPRAIAEVAKSAALATLRRSALDRLTDDKNLSDVARNGKDPVVRKLAVERLQDAQVLRDVAIGEAHKEIGIAAVEQIQETAVLEVVARRARNKQVAAAARERLPVAMGRVERTARPVQEASPEARRRARQAQLIRELEHAIGRSELPAAELAAARVKREWADLGKNPAGDEYQKKLDKVLEKLAIRRRTLEEAHRSHVEAEGAQQKRVEEDRAQIEVREALCAKLEALDGESVRSELERLREEWQQQPRLMGPRGKELEIRFRKAGEAAMRRVDLSLSKVKLREKLEAVVAEAEALEGSLKEVEPRLKGLRKRLLELEAAGFDEELRARFRRVEERIEAQRAELQQKRAADEAEAQVRLEEALGRLEGLLEVRDRKRLEKELKVAQSAFESSRLRGPAAAALRDRYAAVRDQLVARAQEMRETENWERWANVPRLEKLCDQMEAIARTLAAEQAPGAAAARAQPATQGEAGAEAPGPEDEPAAQAAAQGAEQAAAATPERALEPAGAPRAAAEGASQEGAESGEPRPATGEGAPAAERPAIAVEAAPALPEPDAASDAAPAEAASEGAEVAAAAQAPGSGEAVAPTPPVSLPIFGKGGRVDLKKAAALMKVLQAEWKTVGPAPKERSEQLWQRFKGAGDEVYHRTHEGFQKLGQSRGENLKKKEELCAQVEALVAPFAAAASPASPASPADPASPANVGEEAAAAVAEGAPGSPGMAQWKETAEKIKALQEQWKNVGPVNKEQADVVWKRFRAACDAFFGKRKEVSGRASGERSENLKKLEELCVRVEGLVDAPDWKRAAGEIKAAQAEWKAVGAAPRGESDRQWKRFRAACDRFFNRRNQQVAEQDVERQGNLEKKQKLCERADALVEQAREGDRDGAMREAKQLQAEWKKTGPAPREHGDAIWRRFRAACDRIFNPEEETAPAAAPAPEQDPKNWPKFENKLPLAGVLAQLAGANPDEKKKDEPPPTDGDSKSAP